MDRYELMDRAGIEISEEDYDKIEAVYLASPDFTVVGDVVDYIKAHKGSYEGLLERYNDAKLIECYHARINELNRIHDNDVRKVKESEAQLIDSRREVREKQKTIDLLLSVMTTEQKAQLAEVLIKGVEA